MLTGIIFGSVAKSYELKNKTSNKFEPIKSVVDTMKKFENFVHQNMFSKKFYYFGSDPQIEKENQEAVGY